MINDAPWTEIEYANPGRCWRVTKIHHLTPQENGNKHNIYVNVYADGKDVRDGKIALKWGWKGQGTNEPSPAVYFTKPANEPGTNLPIFKGQRIWIQIYDGIYPSDKVSNLYAEFDLDNIPGNSIEHNSYLIEFALQNDGVVTPPPIDKISQIRLLAQQILDLTS